MECTDKQHQMNHTKKMNFNVIACTGIHKPNIFTLLYPNKYNMDKQNPFYFVANIDKKPVFNAPA